MKKKSRLRMYGVGTRKEERLKPTGKGKYISPKEDKSNERGNRPRGAKKEKGGAGKGISL